MESLFKIIIATLFFIMCAYEYVFYRYTYPYVCLYVSEINENNDVRDRREELVVFLLEGTPTTCEVV